MSSHLVQRLFSGNAYIRSPAGIQEPNYHQKREIKLKSVTNFSVVIDVHHRNIVNKVPGIEFGSVDIWQVLP